MTTATCDADPVIERHGRALVVRDDLLLGGTKSRFIVPMVQSDEASEFVYAGPAYGGAAVALAYACRETGKRCTLFYAANATMAPRQRLAASLGARIEFIRPGYLAVVKARARVYCEASGARLVAWGVPSAVERISEAASRLDVSPAEVWCAAGSGTVVRALHRVFAARGARIIGVQVGAELHDLPDGIRVVKHPLHFDQRTSIATPFPSCRHYDAKAWQLARLYASGPFLFWNVARDHI